MTSEGTLPPPELASIISTAAQLLDNSPAGDSAGTSHDVPSSTELHIVGDTSRPIGSTVSVKGYPMYKSSVVESLGMVMNAMMLFFS